MARYGGHDAGTGAGADPGGVLGEGDVAELLRGLTRVAQAGSSRSCSSEAGGENAIGCNRCGAGG